MVKLIFSMLITGVTLTACAPYPREVWTGSDECMYIGCETGGMIYYPHERPQDKNEPGENYEL